MENKKTKYPNKPFLGSSDEVINHEYKYHGMWWDKSDWFWFFSLLEEFTELGLSLLHLHGHPPELELKQIASISIGWMDYIKSRNEHKI